MESFYNYIKEKIKSIPFSASLDVYSLNIEEEDFLSYLKEKYDLYLIYLDNKITFSKNKVDSFEKRIESDENISYYLSLNSKIYMNYSTRNYNKDFKSDCRKYHLNLINIYSSPDKDIYINFLNYISEYIKKNK